MMGVFMQCDYGCGQEATFTTTNSKNCCSVSYKKCPEVLRKNFEGTVKARAEGRKGYTYNPSSNWNKGNFTADFSYGTKGNHKQVLLQERGHRCESCLLETWMEKPIPLEMEHVDGDSRNNVKDNLKLLCPNCHAQTPTWRRRKGANNGKAKYSEQAMIDAIISSDNMQQAIDKLGLKWGSSATLMKVKDRNDLKFKQ
jgi:hypothetical protein